MLDKNKELFRQYTEVFGISVVVFIASYCVAFLYHLGIALEVWPHTIFSSLMEVLVSILIMILVLGIMLSIIEENRIIKHPPFTLAYEITNDFFSKKCHKSEFVPLIDESRDEFFEAYDQKNLEKIIWIKIRFYLNLSRRVIKIILPFKKII